MNFRVWNGPDRWRGTHSVPTTSKHQLAAFQPPADCTQRHSNRIAEL
jgi:hypothetical protein